MSDTPDWDRLATYIRDRRKELRRSQDRVHSLGGPSQATMFKLEKGESTEIKDETKNRLEHGLDWALGSVDRILAGGEPTIALPSGSAGRAEVLDESQGERLLIDIVNGASELSDERRREILALIRAMQDRDTGR